MISTDCYLGFRYLEQPVSDSEVDCNIYESPSIQLRCTVSATIGRSNFSISWFYNGQIIMSGTNSAVSKTHEYRIIKSSVLTIERANYQAGRYYCQVELPVSESNENVQLEPSTVFTLRDEQTYLQYASNCQEEQHRLFYRPLQNCAVHVYVPTTIPSYTPLGHTRSTFEGSSLQSLLELNPDTNSKIYLWIYALIAVVAFLAVIMFSMVIIVTIQCIDHQKHKGNM